MKIYRKVKKTVQIIFWAVFLVVVLVGIFSGWDVMGRWLAAIASGLAVLLYGGQKTQERINEKNQEIQEKEKELDRDAEDRRKKAEALAKEDEEQKEKVEDWRERKNRWKSRGSMMLVLCMLLIAATPARAEVDSYADLTREELIEAIIEAEKLLDEADQRLARETALKEEYRQLYLEAEEDLRMAKELSLQKDEIIMDQAREIEFLRYRLERKKRAWGLSAGTIITGQAASWTLGVSRRRGSLSWTLAVAGGDSFGVEAGVTVWW